MDTIKENIEVALAELLPKAEALAKLQDRTTKACLASLLQPYIKGFLQPDFPKERKDARTRKWNIKLKYINSIDGTNYDVVAECAAQLVCGYAEVVEAIRETTREVHEEEGDTFILDEAVDFSPDDLRDRFNSLRPAISRGGGRAKMYTQYVVDSVPFTCILFVSREEIPLDI